MVAMTATPIDHALRVSLSHCAHWAVPDAPRDVSSNPVSSGHADSKMQVWIDPTRVADPAHLQPSIGTSHEDVTGVIILPPATVLTTVLVVWGRHQPTLTDTSLDKTPAPQALL